MDTHKQQRKKKDGDTLHRLRPEWTGHFKKKFSFYKLPAENPQTKVLLIFTMSIMQTRVINPTITLEEEIKIYFLEIIFMYNV